MNPPRGFGLRGRFALTLALLVIPFAVLFSLGQSALRERLVAQGVIEGIRGRVNDQRLERCEAYPERWPGPDGRFRRAGRRQGRRRPPPGESRPMGAERVFAYDPSLVSAHPDAPPFPDVLRASLAERGQAHALVTGSEGRRRVLAFRAAPEGPCAIIYVEARAPGAGVMVALVPTVLVSAFVIAVAFFAAGPIVRRIRRLTAEVRAARGGERPLRPDARGDEIGELSRAFAEDRAALAARMEELERRDEALTAYIANTTHDVMLPLTVLQGHLMALRSRLGTGA
ncbi:MAG: HAMP domain-containing protein, partial [Myxococcota bacterium]